MSDGEYNYCIEKALLDLIASEYTDNSGNTDWNNVFISAGKHAVIGIVANVLPDTVPEKVLNKWVTYAAKQLQLFHTVYHIQSFVVKVLDKADVKFVILKGTSVAEYYSSPENRSMADIDIAVLSEDFEKAQSALTDAGCELENVLVPGGRHSVLCKSGIRIELHHHFSHGSADVKEPIDSYIRTGIQNAQEVRLYGLSFPVLPSIANGLVILYHISRQLYMGVGLRNIVDWCEYVRNMPANFWNDGFYDAAKECGLDVFAEILTGACIKYLDLPSDGLEWASNNESACELLIKDCLASGNDGFADVSESGVAKASIKLKRKGVFRYLQEAGLYNWKYAHKHRWVRPFAWIYQIFRYIGKTIVNRKNIKNEIGISKERAELLKKVGL